MVGIVSGNGLGVLNSSASILGQLGVAGAAVQGSNKEAAYLNIFNGNLSLTDTDDFLASRGVNVALTRTYNAQGTLNTGNGNAWQYGLTRQVNGMTGTVNSKDSTVLRTAGDGSVARYVYDTAKLAYVTTDGGGAAQSITYNATSKEWTWRGDRNDLLGTVEIYDANNDGRLVAIKDKVGVRQRFQYNAAGRLSQITDATDVVDAKGNVIASGIVGTLGNDQTYFDYDAAGNLSQIRTEIAGKLNEAGTATVGNKTITRARYEYDALNRLTKVGIDLTPEDGSVADGKLYQTTYTYDGDSNRIESITQFDDSVLSFKYDPDTRRVTSFTDALGRQTTLKYLPSQTTVTDPLGQVSVYGYDVNGRLTDITTPDTGAGAQVARFYYDNANGNVIRVTDPRGNDTTYGYDANGNRILERDAAGNTITRAYSLVTNQLLAEARFLAPDADGAGTGVASMPLTTRYTYDANGRLHYVISAEGRVTEYTYNAQGELASELRYNALYAVSGLAALAVLTDAQVISVVTGTTFDRSNVARVDYGYDARGLRASATRFANTGTNGLGLLDGMQSTTRYFYDQVGNLIKTLDGNGNKSEITYDGLGRALTRTDALGNSVVNSYDARSNLTVTVMAANGTGPISVTRQVRDAAGQLISVRQDYGQQSGTVSYVYDADGRLRQSTSATGQKTYWLYDAAGRKVAQIEHNGALTEYVYNAANQVVKTIAYSNVANLGLLNDAQGNPANVALAALRPAADPSAPDRASWNGYDTAGRLVASVDVNGYLTRLAYDGASRLVQTTYRAKPIATALLDTAGIAASYTDETSADDRVSRTFYDGDGKVVAQLDAAGALTENKYNAAGLLIDAITYNNPTTVANRASGTLATLRPAADAVNDIHQRYLYNGKQQIVGTIDGDNYLTELTYDPAGNIATRRHSAVAVTTPAGLTLAAIGKTVSADDRVTTYGYDERNLLSRESTLGGTFVEYRYDAAGNLVSRVSGAGTMADRTSLTRYDGAGHVTAELTQEGAAKLVALGADPATVAVEQIWATSALHYTYNGAGQRLSASDALGNRTLYFYDKMGRQTITVDAGGTVREQQYDDEGLLVKTVQYAKQLGAATLGGLSGGAIDGAFATAMIKLADVSQDRASVFYYDNSGRLAYSVNAVGQVSGQTYNAYNQVSQNVQYDIKYTGVQLRAMKGGRGGAALSELAGIPNNAAGNARSLTYYDANGRLTYTVSPMGEVSAQTYDGIGRVNQTSRYGARLDPSVLSALTGTNADIAKFTVLGAKASVTTLYNRRGQIVDVSDALLGHTLTGYNAFGDIKSSARLATASSLTSSALDISSRTLYDLAGRVLATIDGTGALTLYRYDGAGRLAERTAYATRMAAADATAATAANIATLAAKLVTPPATATLASDQRVRYFYDAAGRVGATATLQRTGATEEWSVVAQRYDANGNVLARTGYATLLKVTDPAAADVAAIAGTTSDAVTHYAYDNLNRVVATAQAQILADGGATAWGVTTIAYDAQGNVASRTQYANMAYGDAPLANLDTSKYTNPAVDRTTRYAYDALDRLVYTLDAVGAVTGVVYDNLGRPSEVTAYAEPSSPVGPIGANFAPTVSMYDRITRTIYNLAGQPVYEIDASGAVSERRYDAYGNLSARVRYATDAANYARLSATTSVAEVKQWLAASADDRTERFVYDLNGRLRFEVDAAGYFKETSYNALGQVVLTASYQTPVTIVEATLATDLAALVTTQNNDAVVGNRPRNTVYAYDAQGNLLSRTEPMLGKQSYTYDALGRKLSMTNALGKTWTYRYDAAGRNIEETSPGFTAYQDAASVAMGGWGGGATTTLVTTLTYDALGNLTKRTEGKAPQQERTTSYGYDRVGRQNAIYLPATMAYDAAAPADGNGRTEKAVNPVIKVWYDALGNAVVNQGADGAVSQKAYDRMGRVAYDIDALGYATGYQRNAFGEATALTRYSLKQSVSAWGGAERVGKDLRRDANNDRTIVTRYDLSGRAVKIIEPATAIYDAHAIGSRYPTAARTTENTYNGFGDVIQQQIYGADAEGTRLTEAASTRYYYNTRGLKSAQIDMLSDTPTLRSGYLSTFEYSDIGKLTRQIDFSAAVTVTNAGYTAGVATDKLNRTTQYAYDKNGNLTTETKVGVDYVNTAGAAVVKGNLVTKYAYDALDRQVGVTNALNQVTNTYYDELGRISAVSRQLTATTAQLTEFKRDLHGNALLRIDYAQAATTASGGSVTVAPTVVGATDTANRVTATSYDISGRAIRVLDAEQYANRADAKAVFSSYDVYGHVVRQWRTVTDNGATSTAWQLNGYDALGRQTWTQTPGNLNLVDNTTASDTRKVNVYNAFGEVIETRLVGGDKDTQLSLTKYDLAGRAWFTNASDGIDTVFLHDALGNVTAQIRSTNADAQSHELRALGSAMGALQIGQQLRTENQYDLLGRQVDSRLVDEPNSVLRWQNGAWAKETPAYNEAVTDSLVILGGRNESGKNYALRYRLKPDGAWTDAGASRLKTVDGYPVFSTGGLAGGDYEFQVLVQPAGEPQYLANTGALHIAATTGGGQNGWKIETQVVRLFMLLLGRPPEPSALNVWVGLFNDGATLDELAGLLYDSTEAGNYRDHSNANAVRLLFQNAGNPQPADAGYAASVALWTARLDQANGRAAIGLVLAALVSAKAADTQPRANAVANYLAQGGSDPSVVTNLIARAASAPGAAIAEGTRAAELESQRRQLARLYIGLFNRAPDKAGFDGWAANLAAGISITQIALTMLGEPEALAPTLLPKTLSSEQYNDKLVKLAYANLMGREPTAAELADAKTGLGIGTPPSAAHANFLVKLGSRVAGEGTGGAPVDAAARTLLFQKTTVALAYAAMPSLGTDSEQIIAVNKAAIAAMTSGASAAAAAHQATLFLQTQALAAKAALDAAMPAAAATPLETLRLALARAYAVVLNRAPGRDGFPFWLNQLKTEGPGALQAIIADMLANEGGNAALYPPSLTDTQFVTRVFTLGMGLQAGSAALAGAIAAWVPKAAGQSRAKLMLDIINSVVLSGDPRDQSMRSLLNNKAAVGVTYAVNFAGTDLGQEQAILRLVTDSDISAAIQYGSASALQVAAEAALATSQAATTAASQTTVIIGAVQGIVAAQTKVDAAQTAANAYPLAAPLLRSAQLYVALLMRGTAGHPDLNLGDVNAMAQWMAAGATDADMAQTILDSTEGRALFPSTNYDPIQFVTQMYNQALGRKPSAAGLAFWSAAAPTVASRAKVAADMLKSFLAGAVSDDDPNKQINQQAQAVFHDKVSVALAALNGAAGAAVTALTAAVAAATDADTKAKAAAAAATAAATAVTNAGATNARKVLEISRLFVGILNRGPGNPILIGGLNFWIRARLDNVSLETIATNFLESDEGKRVFASATTNQAFLNQIFQQVLGRTPPQGDSFWLNQLNAGATRASIALGIITSLTEQTFQAESEYLAKADFNQRVADAMKVVAGTAAAEATAANNTLTSALALKNSTAKTQTDALAALNAANALTVEGDPAVIAAKAAAPRGTAFLNSANVKPVTELLVAFNRPAGFETVYQLVTGGLTGDALLQSIIKPLAMASMADRPAFFTDLFRKILNREPKQAGLDWWVANTTTTDPSKAALDFFKSALSELYSPISGVSTRLGFRAEFDAVNQPNQAQAVSMANGYAPAQALAARQIDQKRAAAQTAYNNSIAPAAQAATKWQEATSYNDVAKLAPAALSAADTVQIASVKADKAAAASLAAAALMPGVAASLGLPASTTLADYTSRLAAATNLQKALALDSTLETTQAALSRANAVRTDAVQNAIDGTTPLSLKVAAVTQIYTAVLNRNPTLLELNLSLGALKNGQSTDELATALIAASTAVYPAGMTNDAFVTKVYTQAMGRAPKPEGLRFWSDALNGANGLSRGAVVMSIIRSLTVENINADSLTFNTRVAGYLNTLSAQALDASTPAKNAATLADFLAANTATARLEATNFDAAAQAALSPAALYETELTQLYVSVLGRSPEPAALINAIALRAAGTTLAAIALSMLDAPEARLRFAAGISDTQFVTDFYRLGLGRAADAAELAAALALLAGGKNTRGQVIVSLLKDLYAYNGNDALKAATRTNFMGKVGTSLERSVLELDRFRSNIDMALERSGTMETAGLLTQMTDGTVAGRTSFGSELAVQATARTTLDRWGNVLTVTDPRDPNWKISYTYNHNNQQLTATANALAGSALVPTSTTEYDALGRVARTADAVANQGKYFSNRIDYDASGNVATETHADGGKVSYHYNLFGDRTDVITQRGFGQTDLQTNFAYDHLGHMVRSWSQASVVSYGSRGWGTPNQTAVEQATAQLVQQNDYDELGHLVKSTGADGIATRNRYDLDGNLIQVTNGEGYITRNVYDAFHHKTATVDANGARLNWAVDAWGVISKLDNTGSSPTRLYYNNNVETTGSNVIIAFSTTYRYDAAGRKIQQGSSAGQNIEYGYTDGLLTRIDDKATGLTTTYRYDLAGNRLTEKQTYAAGREQAGTRQNNTLVYDMQNRVTDISDDNYKLHYDYDANGNRLHVRTEYDEAVAGVAVHRTYDTYNAYDNMNRQVVVNGDKDAATGLPVYGKSGHAITYDYAGNRLSDTSIGKGIVLSGTYQVRENVKTVEEYVYDVIGRLSDVRRDGFVINTRHYDLGGRVAETGLMTRTTADGLAAAVDAIGGSSETHIYAYGADGQLNSQQDNSYVKDRTTGNMVRNIWFGEGYDRVGNLRDYTVAPASGGSALYTVTYEFTDGYRETSNRNSKSAVVNVSGYDVNGNRTTVTDASTGKVVRNMAFDADGHVQSRIDIVDGKPVEHFSLIVNGQVLGEEDKQATTVLGSTYAGVSASSQTAPPAFYSVQSAGETLQSIAQNIWGDSKLWYLIADANGIDGSTKLAPGDQLRIPTRVNTVHNDYATFKPYDAAEALGNTAPAMPPPSQGGGGCGGVGMLIMVVVAIAVTVITAGAAAALGPVMAGALGAAAGSVASQVVGMAIGAQDKFSWKGVAMAALGGAITAGVTDFAAAGSEAGSWGSVLDGKEWTAVASRAAVSNVVTQGVGNITGLQKGFSWASVAASYVGAAVGNQVTSGLEGRGVFSGLSNDMAKFAVDSASGFASGLSASVVRGGKIEVARIATDAFGNALGSSLAENMQPTTAAPQRTFADSISKDPAWLEDWKASNPNIASTFDSENADGGTSAPIAELVNPDLDDNKYLIGDPNHPEWAFAPGTGKQSNGLTIKRNEYSLEVANAVKKMNDVDLTNVSITKEMRTLAAVAYGEASVLDDPAEVGAIANVIKRQADARNRSVDQFIAQEPSYAFAADGTNERYNGFINRSKEEILKDRGYSVALKSAINALDSSGYDFSDGAYFWDGRDLKTNYENHPKVKVGVHFSDPSDNIYDVKETSFPKTEYYYNNGVATKVRGTYDHKYDSTAAYGQTVFWKYNSDFIKATGNKVYK